MLAPIALYPDALLSQILMAATYPAEVMEAARWSREHPDFKGDAAVNAADEVDWDPSVISLTAFPQILAEMDARPEWTEQLGDAFLSQQAQVMDTVQTLRQQAQAAGNLQSSEQVRVLQQGQTIVIEQAAPEVVYVPYYSPTVVYGPWWWDAYPPIYWDPWPGYYSGFRPGYYWGSGIHVGLGFFYSSFDWHRHHVNVHRHHHRHLRHQHNRQRLAGGLNTVRNKPQQWEHDPSRRHNVPYGVPALQNRFPGNHLPPRNVRDVLSPRDGSPLAPREALTRSQTRQENFRVPAPVTSQGSANSGTRNLTATELPVNAALGRQTIPTPNAVIPGASTGTVQERLEALKRRDNLLVSPNIPPQTRAVVPRSPNPMTVPRQPLSQPPMRRFEPPAANGGPRVFDRQQQAMPNNRSMQQQSMSPARSGPSAQPRSLGPGQPRIGNNPLQGKHGQSRGGGQNRH